MRKRDLSSVLTVPSPVKKSEKPFFRKAKEKRRMYKSKIEVFILLEKVSREVRMLQMDAEVFGSPKTERRKSRTSTPIVPKMGPVKGRKVRQKTRSWTWKPFQPIPNDSLTLGHWKRLNAPEHTPSSLDSLSKKEFVFPTSTDPSLDAYWYWMKRTGGRFLIVADRLNMPIQKVKSIYYDTMGIFFPEKTDEKHRKQRLFYSQRRPTDSEEGRQVQLGLKKLALEKTQQKKKKKPVQRRGKKIPWKQWKADRTRSDPPLVYASHWWLRETTLDKKHQQHMDQAMLQLGVSTVPLGTKAVQDAYVALEASLLTYFRKKAGNPI